jgi:branched-chain amino acid transport system substrate-binding protein
MRRNLIALSGLAMLLGATCGARAEEVVVGAQYPLSGAMASYSGPFLREGTELALQRVNETHLLGEGRTLKILIEDNAGDRNQAISLMNRFASADNVIAVLGVYGSFLSLPAAPVANDLKVPFLAIAVSDAISQAGPWSFSLLEPADVQMDTLGKFAVDQLHVKTIALVYDRANDASVRMRDSFSKYLTSHGTTIVSVDSITAQDTNFQPIATKIVNEKIDALFVESVPSVAANFLIQARQAGLDPDVRILSSGQIGSPVFLNIAGKAADGVYYAVDYLLDMPNAENKDFIAAYRKLHQKDPDQNAAWAYAGTMLLARAIKDAGPGADRAKVREALAALNKVPTVLGAGSYSFGERKGYYPAVVVRVVNGKPEPVPQ